MAKLRITGVDKTYLSKNKGQQIEALRNINMAVEENEFAVIVGPSGCGKSTLLNIVAGLEHCDAGEVLMDGTRRILSPGADRGMVFQSYTLFPWLPVKQNVEFGLKLKKLPQPSGKPYRSIISPPWGLAALKTSCRRSSRAE
jgi:NitT/TauT family transport system ATP-binding protein